MAARRHLAMSIVPTSAALILVLGLIAPFVSALLCFKDGAELTAAVNDYIASGYDPTANSSILFGYPIENWCVDNVQDFSFVFENQATFNEPLTNWITSSATNMEGMFSGASSFNQPVDFFDTGAASELLDMFNGASSFNQDISSWNLTSAVDLSGMFDGASAFSQDLCRWSGYASGFSVVDNMFAGTACPSTSDPVLTATPPGPFCFTCVGTNAPTNRPTVPPGSPTLQPTKAPVKAPTKRPTKQPTTRNPNTMPTKRPTKKPTAPQQTPTKKPSAPNQKSVKRCIKKLRQRCNCGLVFRGSPCFRETVKNCDRSGNQKQFISDVRYHYKQVFCRRPPL